jgi:Pretoxin HINT domain
LNPLNWLAVGKLMKGVEAAIKTGKKVVEAEEKARKLAEKAAKEKKLLDEASKCFTAGTLVNTSDGLKPIEEIQVGDLVESRDEVTKETTWKSVVKLIHNKDKVTLTLTLNDNDGNSDVIGVTPEHPFRVEGKGWVNAGELNAGAKVIGAKNKLLTVKASVRDKERHDTYNFEVADYHTYFVGTLGAWVHNACRLLPEVNKAVNSNMAHAVERGVEHGVFPDAKTATDQLRNLSN